MACASKMTSRRPRRSPPVRSSLLKTALLMLSMMVGRASPAIHSDQWVSCTANQTTLALNGVQTMTVTGLSPRRCTIYATSQLWPVLACHSLDASNTCTMWGYSRFILMTVVKNDTLGLANCKATTKFLGCLMLNNYDVRAWNYITQFKCATSEYKFQCTPEGIVFIPVVPTMPLTACTAPFNQTSVGCIYVETAKQYTFSAARMICFNYGVDLVSPDSYQELLDLQQFIRSTYPSTSNWLLVGLMRLDWAADKWRWAGNGRIVEGAERRLELASQSNGTTEFFAYITPWPNYTLSDMGCPGPFGFVCEYKGV